jgi:hypothetical protein
VRRLFLLMVVPLMAVSIGIGMLPWMYEGPRRLALKLRTRGS